MTAKKSAEVIIDGKVYTLSGYEEEGYLQKVGTYINSKIGEFAEMDEFRNLSVDTRHTLIELNIADDYFKAKESVEKLELDMEQKEKEIYDLKHDLIADQLKIEDLEERLKSLETENKELSMQKSKLEASLEDALLGDISN
ncbi:MAG: cell division protein ZapA [Lachnospiraceae bacterium]|nr:cell division protein ZapA [Lachnospiraceae bacterium]MDD6193253.1 cell division protein ZapA [Lachnospiraceae bacterium]MDY4794195.1 cell division protein ZapA [Pararoseburia sp.]